MKAVTGIRVHGRPARELLFLIHPFTDYTQKKTTTTTREKKGATKTSKNQKQLNSGRQRVK